MRVLFTDASDGTLICALVTQVRYDPESSTMGLCCPECDFSCKGIRESDYNSYLSKLLTYGYLDLSAFDFKED